MLEKRYMRGVEEGDGGGRERSRREEKDNKKRKKNERKSKRKKEKGEKKKETQIKKKSNPEKVWTPLLLHHCDDVCSVFPPSTVIS